MSALYYFRLSLTLIIIMLHAGSINRPQDSLFTYPEDESWANYTFPNFAPTFEVVFSNPSLEQEADDLCGDDFFCRFDIATTENTMVGLSTLNGGQEFEDIVNISRPSKQYTFLNSIPKSNTMHHADYKTFAM